MYRSNYYIIIILSSFILLSCASHQIQTGKTRNDQTKEIYLKYHYKIYKHPTEEDKSLKFKVEFSSRHHWSGEKLYINKTRLSAFGWLTAVALTGGLAYYGYDRIQNGYVVLGKDIIGGGLLITPIFYLFSNIGGGSKWLPYEETRDRENAAAAYEDIRLVIGKNSIEKKCNSGGIISIPCYLLEKSINSEGKIPVAFIPVRAPELAKKYLLDKSVIEFKKSDVDIVKLSSKISNRNTIAVLIGNENYKNKKVPSVPFAKRDAKAMKNYLIKSFGFNPKRIYKIEDLTLTNFRGIFGTEKNYKSALWGKTRSKDEVFIYYSGHGVPGKLDHKTYLLPANANPDNAQNEGYSLELLYNNLAKLPSKNATVVIDACFSGMSDGGEIVKGWKGTIFHLPVPDPNMVIITSSKGYQISHWHPEGLHSLFTYCFLKGLQGSADLDKNKKIDLNELDTYVVNLVSRYAKEYYQTEQTPEFNYTESKVIVDYE